MGESVKAAAKTPVKNTENRASQKKTEVSQVADSPAEQILFLQKNIGNRAVERLIKSGDLQTKLGIENRKDASKLEVGKVIPTIRQEDRSVTKVRPESATPERDNESPRGDKKRKGAKAKNSEGVSTGPEAVSISAEDPEQILEQLKNVQPTSAVKAYNQVQEASSGILKKQKQNVEQSLPEIPVPTGLPPKESHAEEKGKVATTPENAPTAFESEKSGKEGEEYKLQVEGAPPPPPIKPTVLSGGETEESSDTKISQGAQNELEDIQIDTSQISTSTGEGPAVDITGEADPSQLGSFQSESDAKVQNAKADASREIYQDFGENDIFPESTDKTLKSSKALSSPKIPSGKGDGALSLPPDAISGLNQSLGPNLRERIGEKKEEYGRGKEKFDSDSANARVDADKQIANLNKETSQKQIEEQNKLKTEVSKSREEWKAEIDGAEKDYQIKASKATGEQREKIAKEKQKGEEKAAKHLDDAEKKAEKEKLKAEKDVNEKKKEKKKESKGFWGWVKSAASALIDGLKKAVNFIYDTLRTAVKLIFEAAKALVKAAIELARMVIVGLIKGFALILKGLVTVVFAAFPNIARKINSKIDKAVNFTVKAVNKAAEFLKKGVEAVLDFLASTLDKLLGLIQSLYNGIFTVIGMIIRGEFKELMERIGNLVKAAKTMPDQFETAGYEELLGGNLDEPLSPIELAQAGKTPIGSVSEGSQPMGETGLFPSPPWSEENVGVDQVAHNMELSPELESELIEVTESEGEVELGDSTDKTRTMESIMSEVSGQKTSEKEEQKHPDDGLSPRQRAEIKWQLMKNGISKWWEENRIKIIAGAIAAIVGVIALIIVTGGSILAAIPPIMSVLGPLFVGVTVATLVSHVRDYFSKAWDGDIRGGGKSLAKGLAAGAIELISWITFKAGGAALKGAKALAKGGIKLAKGAARIIAKGAKFVIEKGKVLFKGIASGVGKQFKRIKDFGKGLLSRLRFKKFRIRISNRRFVLEGYINPWIEIANGQIVEVPKGTKGAEFRTKDEIKALREAGKAKPGKLTKYEAVEYKVTKTQGKVARGKVGDRLTGDHIPSKASLVKAEEIRLGRKLKPKEVEHINNEGITVVLKGKTHAELSRTYGGRNTQAQILKDAQDLGQAFSKDAEAILKGLKNDRKLTDEIVGAYLEAYRKNVIKGTFKYSSDVDKMFMSFLKKKK